jgi:hypothetical protein
VGRVPLLAAVICPHPPLLDPRVAAGAASELDGLRAACDGAIERLIGAGADRVVIVGSGPDPSGAELGRPDSPLSLAIGEWLLARSGGTGVAEMIATDAAPEACARLGTRIAGESVGTALLVMGDGSACRGPQAPGYDDPRAEEFDRSVVSALAAADPTALLGLDPVLAAELRCAGRAPWQVLAGALAADGRAWSGDLRYEAAPYGVAYFVAALWPAAQWPEAA